VDAPNIIVVLCDDLGYGDIGCYGSTATSSTPRLDQMARDGVRLTDFYMPSAVCSPSRAAVMTGCYPKRIGLDSGQEFDVLLPGDQLGLSPNEITIASLLKSVGYRTKLVGKWHLGDQPPFLPTNHGFDSFFGLPFSNDMLPGHPLLPHFSFPPLPLMRDEDVIEIDPNQAALTFRYTAEAVGFIQSCAKSGDPFFLYFAHMYPHVPIHAPMRYLFGSDYSVNSPYQAAVAHIDDALGTLIDALEQLGMTENTIVIFTSDHGPDGISGGASSGALRGGKATTWEGGMRVPCLIQWKGVIPAGSKCTELTTAMDLLPTIASIAGVPVPEDRTIDGKDIGPLLMASPGVKSPHEAFFYYGVGDHYLHAVRSGRWKLHLIRNELYDLETDIGESVDVFDEYPDVIAALHALADQCRKDLGDAYTRVDGKHCRVPGWVDDATPLTSMDMLDPLVRPLYEN
jgi:arylsulfatase A